MQNNVYPFSDEMMIYDMNMHKYVLTEKYVLAELGEDLSVLLNTGGDVNPSTLPKRVLKRVSNSVYNYIYEYVWSSDFTERLMALYPPLRDRIKSMLIAQLQYVLDNGFVNHYSGINMAKGTALDINVLRGRAKVADEVEQLAAQIVPGLGRSLLFAGRTPGVTPHLYHVGY